MDDVENRDGVGIDTPTSEPERWEEALAYSALKDELKTAADNRRFIDYMEESLRLSLGIEPEAAREADLAGILSLFFTGETFSFTDEDGTRYLWSVTRAKEVIAAAQLEPVAFHPLAHDLTAEHILSRYPSLDKAKAKTVDFAEPVIFASFKGEHLLIDGWHRVYRAVTQSIPAITCYVLTEEETDTILVSKTPKGEGIS